MRQKDNSPSYFTDRERGMEGLSYLLDITQKASGTAGIGPAPPESQSFALSTIPVDKC